MNVNFLNRTRQALVIITVGVALVACESKEERAQRELLEVTESFVKTFQDVVTTQDCTDACDIAIKELKPQFDAISLMDIPNQVEKGKQQRFQLALAKAWNLYQNMLDTKPDCENLRDLSQMMQEESIKRAEERKHVLHAYGIQSDRSK